LEIGVAPTRRHPNLAGSLAEEISVAKPGTGFETGLDLSTDEFTVEERERILRWYVETHGTGTLDLVKFAPFLIEHEPGSFKRYRRHVATIAQPLDGVGLPQAVVGLLFLHTYTAIANERGVLYEVIAAREWGATKREVMETIGFAFLEAAPRGINAAAELSDEYLREWVDDGRPTRIEWPAEWAADVKAFQSGIDVNTDDLAPAELDAIVAWHRKMHGSDGVNIRRLAKLHPSAFKTHRIRYERAASGSLPAQMFPLYTLHLATVKRRPAAMRSSLQMAKQLGVNRHHAVQTMWWGLLYGGETMLDDIMEITGDLWDPWEPA
jgi:hypothetical protein